MLRFEPESGKASGEIVGQGWRVADSQGPGMERYSSGSWVTMWTSTAGDSRRNLCTAERYRYFLQSCTGARPKITCVMCFERTNSATVSATLRALRRTTLAPRLSAKRRLAAIV